MKRVVLDRNFLFSKEVMPFQGNDKSNTSPAPDDIPQQIDIAPTAFGEVAMQFIYGDREEADAEESILDSEALLPIHVKRGMYSGKIMSLRVPGGKEGVPALVENLRMAAPRQKRKNQELNFLLLSNILQEKQGEIQFTV